MKRIITGQLFLCLFLLFTGQAHAYIIDTGENTSSGSGFALERYSSGDYQWTAGEVQFAQAETIRSIEAYFYNQASYGGAAGDITIKVFGNTNAAVRSGPDESNLLLSGIFFKGAADPGGWYGLYNQNLSLGPGSYWVAFEAVDPSTFRGDIAAPATPLSSYLTPPGSYPDAYVWQNNYTGAPGSPYWNINGWVLNGGSNPFSLRLGDQFTGQVPEPASLLLLGLGVLGLAGIRRKL